MGTGHLSFAFARLCEHRCCLLPRIYIMHLLHKLQSISWDRRPIEFEDCVIHSLYSFFRLSAGTYLLCGLATATDKELNVQKLIFFTFLVLLPFVLLWKLISHYAGKTYIEGVEGSVWNLKRSRIMHNKVFYNLFSSRYFRMLKYNYKFC